MEEDWVLNDGVGDPDDHSSSSRDEDSEEFPLDFKEYMLRELKWSRMEIFGQPEGYPDYPYYPHWSWGGIRWVFWSRQDDEPDRPPPPPTLPNPYENVVDLDFILDDAPTRPNVYAHKIRDALQRMIVCPQLNYSLIQFWAATTTSEGRTLLTTQNQPFALGKTFHPDERDGLCEYRMISKEYRFYGDAESGEEELGLPGRVFLHKSPISSPDVKYYSVKEYPLREHALRCRISSSWAVPVFKHSSQICVGVLELVSVEDYAANSWHEKSFLGDLCDVFQELGLQCFDACKHFDMQYKDENEALTAALHELKMVMESVCTIHKLPLALTWVPCCACNDLLQGQLRDKVVRYCNDENEEIIDLLNFSDRHHLSREQLVGRAVSLPDLLYCSDVTQFSIVENPLVPHVRKCGLSSWFAISLQSSYTGNDVFLLEFFWPCGECAKSWTLLTRILGTMKKRFKTFKLASGKELGEELPVEVVDFQDGQRHHFVHSIQADRPLPSLELSQNGGVTLQQLDSSDQPPMDVTNGGMNVVSAEQNNIVFTSSEEEDMILMQGSEHKKPGVRIEIPLEDILQTSKMRRKDAASELKVSISTLKRVCRDYGIHRWPPRNIKKVRLTPPSCAEHQERIPQLNSDMLSNQASASVARIKSHDDTATQDANMVTVRAKYINDITIKFRLSMSSGLVELQQQVAKRLKLEDESYYVKYKDEEGETILIACDEDLQDCIHTSTSLGNTSVVVLLEPK